MKKILVVDDEPILNSAYCNLLEESGFEVRGATDPKIGLEILNEFKPDGIILDLNMPIMDGIGFLESADVDNKHPGTKVVLFSVSDEDSRIEKAFSLGTSRYVVKGMLAPADLEKIARDEFDD